MRSMSWSASIVVCCAGVLGCSSESPPVGGDAAMTATDAVSTPDSATPAGTALDAITRMCMMNNACGYQSIYLREADRCVDTAIRKMLLSEQERPEHRIHFRRMVECARTATNCANYVRCADFDIVLSGVVTPGCRGNVADQSSTPGVRGPRTFDCSALSGGTCAGGYCVYPLTTPCTAVGQSRCDGATRVWCRATSTPDMGTEIREACPDAMECQGSTMYSTSDVVCMPPLRPCTAPAARCDGDTAVFCTSDPRPGMSAFIEQRQDCARAGLRCVTDSRGRPSCAPSAEECMAATSGTSGVCDGSAIRVCVQGRSLRLDCPTVGATRCEIYPGIPEANIPPSPVCRSE